MGFLKLVVLLKTSASFLTRHSAASSVFRVEDCRLVQSWQQENENVAASTGRWKGAQHLLIYSLCCACGDFRRCALFLSIVLHIQNSYCFPPATGRRGRNCRFSMSISNMTTVTRCAGPAGQPGDQYRCRMSRTAPGRSGDEVITRKERFISPTNNARKTRRTHMCYAHTF